MSVPKCWMTGKTRYADQPIAARELRRIRAAAAERDDPNETVPERCYECDACKGWHLTSQPVEDEPPKAIPPGRRRTRRW